MAQTMTCDGPVEGAAIVVINQIADAEVLAFCPACLADWCQGYLQIFDPERLAPAPSPRPRKSRPKAAAAVADDSTGGETDAPASSS